MPLKWDFEKARLIALEQYRNLIRAQEILGSFIHLEPMTMGFSTHIMGEDYVPFFVTQKRNEVITALKSIVNFFSVEPEKLFELKSLRVLNEYLDADCESLGAHEVIERLTYCGADRETLINMSFDEDDINAVIGEE